ncbi:hypothetical protein [Prevotella sp. MGM2]|uniref:hypothetical protein n=1 Tax=Prevotella sp. MGM2 TaxID=2033406 RepID=UPI001CBFBDF5|nr:hypothetical protein [Prevotella sp. MGM2]
MKKYFYLFFVALFATMSFALTSCSDDDDEPNDPNNGKMELTIDGKKHVFTNTMADVNGNDYSCLVYNNDNELNFSIYGWDEVVKGSALTDENFTLTWSTDEAIIGMPTSNTSVKVTEKNSKNVTISFSNATFEDMRGFESFIVNGTITLPIN